MDLGLKGRKALVTGASKGLGFGWELTLMSVVRLCKHALPHLKRSGRGRIVYLGSTSTREPIPNILQSNAYRSAVVATLKTLAGEAAQGGGTGHHMATRHG